MAGAWNRVPAALSVAAVLGAPAGDLLAQNPRHRMEITIHPESHLITVTDRIRLPDTREFRLNASLEITHSEPSVSHILLAETELSATSQHHPPLKAYRVETPTSDTLTLSYQGALDHGLSPQEEEYTRGFRETAGIVAQEKKIN